MAYKNHKLWYQSSYDRGLDVLLELWPQIKEKFPDATLDIAYGWDLFDKAAANNKERQQWKTRVNALMDQPGITHHGRVGKQELGVLRKECGILAYPTYFPEIFMIGAVESQLDGLVPVTMNKAALPETVGCGRLVGGDIKDQETIDKWLEALFEIMGDKKLWKSESNKGKKFAKKFFWKDQASKWLEVFDSPPKQPLVTIYTPTIREGFWNLMANNIASQTYKNVEWLIVDDHEDDRSKISKKYAKMYGITIRYLRGKDRTVKRTYSLVNANNTALENAKGELMVFLQDFVLMPVDGIQKAVEVFNHNPNDLQAFPDVYYSPKIEADTSNKEDWFNGEIDVAGEFLRKNQRIQGKGFRETRSPFDWEANYGAIPVSIARKVGGWYEFFDEALGFDNTEIAYRAMTTVSRCYIDESNIGLCIDHHSTLGKDEGGKSVNRTRRLNDPRFDFLVMSIKEKKLSPVRTQSVDDQIDLQYEIPPYISDEQCAAWIKQNSLSIAKKWMKEYWE